jgi:D-sedoheptulose 7-phosphate isomerase
MSEELVGRFNADRRPLPAIALVADPTLMTCIANDYGFDGVFPRQVEGLGQEGDVLVIFSTSGNGEGLVRSVEAAKAKGVRTVALLGKGGGAIVGTVDAQVVVPSDVTARVQEAHQLIMHVILEAVDAEFA